jgi:predicted DNA binding CopG/RHH family protein
MKKKIPNFKSDAAAERFVSRADLTRYDLSGLKPVRFEFEKKSAELNMRLPEPLLESGAPKSEVFPIHDSHGS